jgi:hypothetical protein
MDVFFLPFIIVVLLSNNIIYFAFIPNNNISYLVLSSTDVNDLYVFMKNSGDVLFSSLSSSNLRILHTKL